ncbi:MAG: hypothetical protein ABS75_04780 [Pelagibacterium sp. SCN 63-23]|nr:MAG: hypothetical protein ABS75_04780 [Pelagibacterium sp. SCN 63-23]
MTDPVTVLVTVLTEERQTITSPLIRYPLPIGELTRENMGSLARDITPTQLHQVMEGVTDLRRAFSAQLIREITLARIRPDYLARYYVASDDAIARLNTGGVLISVPTLVNYAGGGALGRPDATPIDDTFKVALAQAVARFDRLGSLAEGDQIRFYEVERVKIGQKLQAQASLFNLNAGHFKFSKNPVQHWCESKGPDLLAAAYELSLTQLETALDMAFAARLRTRSFEALLNEEIAMAETILVWVSAYRAYKEGEASRRDSIRRVLKKQSHDWESGPGAVEPPPARSGVRQQLVAHRSLGQVSSRNMIKAAILYDLEPAYGVLLTRLYLVPILCAAGLVGKLGLRRQNSVVAAPIAAGGLIAFVQERDFANAELTGLAGEKEAEDEIEALQAIVERAAINTGVSISLLARAGLTHLRTGEPVSVYTPGKEHQFFLDDTVAELYRE